MSKAAKPGRTSSASQSRKQAGSRPGQAAKPGKIPSARQRREPTGSGLGQALSSVKRVLQGVVGAISSGMPARRTTGRPARAPTSAPPPSAASRPGTSRTARRARTDSVPRPRPRPAARSAEPAAGVVITGDMGPRYDEILTPAALDFVGELHRSFDRRRRDLLQARVERQRRFDAGELPDFLPETEYVRKGDWTVAPLPADLLDRRVEITGPVDRKMIVNAVNSGATDYMADFEDANSPTWSNNLDGQVNVKDYWAGRIGFTDPSSGKQYEVGSNPAVMIVRPRGWHLLEEHLTVDGEPVSGALFDFGLYVFHNAKTLVAKGSAPYFYLPKLESHQEAALWNDVFVAAQERLDIPTGTFKATVLIETLPAAFEMDEILWELRDHIAGLNAGRWDYIFSFIKKLRNNPDYVLPDRGQVVMGKAFLGAYAALLVKTCHRRGAFAMGGMAAQIPIKNNPEANEAAFAKVRADKEREVREGHDGTWVAHPDLGPVAKEVFDRLMPQPNQLDKRRDDVEVTRDDLLRVHEGTKTEDGFRLNIRVGVQYIEAWLRGRGAVPIYNLMEDAATAEISRAQIWQWIKYGATLENGIEVTPEFFEQALVEEMERVRQEVGPENYASGRFPEAIDLFRKLSLAAEFEDFLTIPAYRMLV
jgi:malate synthase